MRACEFSEFLMSAGMGRKSSMADPRHSSNFPDRQWLSLHISRRRFGLPRPNETNQLDNKILRHFRAGTVRTYSLSGKICRHSLNDRRLKIDLEQ